MDRREFLIKSATGIAALAAPAWLKATPSRPAAKLARLADDRYELISEDPDRLRILQITDTHFGTPKPANLLTDAQTKKLIRALVDQQNPALIFHTGDFINNDTEGVDHSAIDFMNDLGTPWSLVFGNHDHSKGQKNGISLDDYYKRLQNHAVGFHTYKENGLEKRDYCFRIDIRPATGPIAYSLFAFNCGSPITQMVVTESQLNWLRSQLEADKRANHDHPILVMQHIPTIEYKTLFEEKAAIGRQGEKVCFESDMGAVFETYRASARVKAVFCGHDHVNDYFGDHKGIKLAYGRVSGWSGYGDWQRGGRVIDLDLKNRSSKTRVVLPQGAVEKQEWNKTLTEGQIGRPN